MIEINERFTVPASPADVYAVLSDPNAVVECVAGAALGEHHEDGSFDGSITVKFSALRIAFKGRVSLELDEENLRGTMKAKGRDGQGGTRFQCDATFAVAPEGDGSVVTATGEVELAGKLAGVIEGAANAVVKRMTGEFVAALTVRCASGSTQLGPRTEAPAPVEATSTSTDEAPQGAGADSAPTPAPVAGAVLLLHGFGDTPNSLRAWGEALADAGFTVNIPRLPGHGARWQELNKTKAEDWYKAAEDALLELHGGNRTVYVMGISLGATLALRLAELHPAEVGGVVAVNPVATGLNAAPKLLGVVRHFRRSVRAAGGDVKRSGVTHVGYDRIPLNAAFELQQFASLTVAALGTVKVPILIVSSEVDHVVPTNDGVLIWSKITGDGNRRATVSDSYHLVPLDNDAPKLFEESVNFAKTRAATKTAQ